MALAHFQETIGRTLSNGDVFIGAGAQVEVRDETSGALSAIFSDRDGNTSKDNPFNADSQGFADFYVATGRYRVKASFNGQVTLDLRDVEVLGDVETLPITTSTGEQTLAEALDDRSIQIDSIADIQNLSLESISDNQGFLILGYYPSSDYGGGRFYYDAARAKSDHDGAKVISPTVPWDGLESTQADFVAGTGETDGAGTGVFVALDEMAVERFGAVGDGVIVDTARVQAAADYGRVVSHNPDLEFLVGEVDAPRGCYVDGDATLTFSAGPLDGVKLHVAQQEANGGACMFVHESWSLADLLQMKALGYGRIMHYLQGSATGGGTNGTELKIVNNCEASGIDLILRSYSDTPTLPNDDRDIVVGYYIFDEPQNNGISVAAQNTRIDAHKDITDKSLYIAAHGEHSFSSDTLSDRFDCIYFDPYYSPTAASAQTVDLSNKANALVGYCELSFKCPSARLIPIIGLFTSTNFDEKAKQISFAHETRGLGVLGNTDFAVFGWDPTKITSAATTADVHSDAEFLEQSRIHAKKKDIRHWKIECIVFVSNGTPGLGMLNREWDTNFSDSSSILRPFYVEDVGSLVSERQRDFEEWGIGVGGAGGKFVFKRPCLGALYARLIYENHQNADDMNIRFISSNNDWYKFDTLHNAGAISDGNSVRRHISGNKMHQYGLELTTNNATANRIKFVFGYIINTDWETTTF